MTTGTETSASTGERHKKLMAAIRPADPGKAMLKITAFKELFDRRVDGRTPESIALLITIVLNRLELRVKLLDLPSPRLRHARPTGKMLSPWVGAGDKNRLPPRAHTPLLPLPCGWKLNVYRPPEASWRISPSNEITEHQISVEIAILR
jgi:hypothetical protein